MIFVLFYIDGAFRVANCYCCWMSRSEIDAPVWIITIKLKLHFHATSDLLPTLSSPVGFQSTMVLVFTSAMLIIPGLIGGMCARKS